MKQTPFGPLESLRDRAIPAQAPAIARRAGYRAHPLDLDDPRSAEPLVDLVEAGVAGVNWYAQARNPPYWRAIPGATPLLLARAGVVARLLAVNARLQVVGLELFVFDAWRPRAVQAYFHGRWMPERLRAADPSLEGAALTEAVERYWSAPTDG